MSYVVPPLDTYKIILLQNLSYRIPDISEALLLLRSPTMVLLFVVHVLTW